MYWLPIIVWTLFGLSVVFQERMISSLQEKGQLPPKSAQLRLDLAAGKYDHIRSVRHFAHLTQVLFFAFMLAAVSVVLLSMFE